MRTVALLSIAAGSAFAAPFNGYERAASGLNTAAVAAGKLYFGSATDNPELTDTAYTKELNNTADFGQITPGNSMKWDAIEPSRNTFSYAKGDAIADLAKANGQKLRCHNLVWYNQLPSWVSDGGFDNATLIEILKNHITNEVTHYKGQCYAWDVVNEAISDNGDGSWRSNVFYGTIGKAYIPIAFAAAAAADPNVKLYYNDYSIENAGAKATAAEDIVKLVQSYGVKIDGVGLQSHFIVGSTPSTDAQVSQMKAFTALGVEVAITELDIRTTTPESDADLSQQVPDYASTVKACMQVEKCVGITIWDYTDKYSWILSTFSGEGAALPWDEHLDKKVPVYNAILSAEAGSTAASTAASSATSAAASSASTVAAVAASSSTSSAEVHSITSTYGAESSTTSSSSSPVAPVTASSSSAAPYPISSAAASSTSAYSTGISSSVITASSLVSVGTTSAVSYNTTAYTYPTSFTTFTTPCTEVVNGTTTTALHTHSAPVYPSGGFATSTGSAVVAPITTGTYPTPTGSDDDCEVEYVYV